MIKIFPSTNSIIDDGDRYIFLYDHMPPPPVIRHDQDTGWHKNTIIDLCKTAGIDHAAKIFVTDHYLLFGDFNNIKITENVFVRNCTQFLDTFKKYEIDFTTSIKYQLAFMSNKPRAHRILCSTIIANLFTNISYSFIPGNDHALLNQELLLNTNYSFDEQLTLTRKWNKLEEVEGNYGGAIKGIATDNILFKSLHHLVYVGAATAIVTEPCFFENGNILTEKTLMAIYAGHFMIWPGAWKLAETAKRIGLDVFEDYIDHSYQYLEHPGERVAEAFLRNKTFLDNIELQQEARLKCKDRLQANLDLVRDIPRLTAAIQSLSTYVPV